jgi:hypothetical protein
VDYTIIGDPSPGCAKEYVAKWTCSGGVEQRTARATAEAGFGSKVVLKCAPDFDVGKAAGAYQLQAPDAPPTACPPGSECDFEPTPQPQQPVHTTERPGRFTGADIVDKSIEGIDIGDNTVTGGNIKDGSIQGKDIASGTVTGDKIADNAITSNTIQDGSIKGEDIAVGTVTGDKIAHDAITTASIQDGSIKGEDIGNAAICRKQLCPEILAMIDRPASSGVRTGQTMFPKNKSSVAINLMPGESKPYNVVVSIAEVNGISFINQSDRCFFLSVSSSGTPQESFNIDLLDCATGNPRIAISDFVVNWILVSR